jgi:hypothetical protein
MIEVTESSRVAQEIDFAMETEEASANLISGCEDQNVEPEIS